MSVPAAKVTQFPFPTRERYDDAAASGRGTSPALTRSEDAGTPPRAGEAQFTPGERLALLKMRGSDWSKAVLAHLKAFGKADCTGADYRSLAERGLARNCGSYHVLTPHGRWRADVVAMEIARAEGMHVMTYDLAPRSRGAACARCTCGWHTYVSRTFRSYVLQVHAAGRHHLQHVGQFVASEAAE